ncbi:hypothetical protein MINTM019_20620 [Mycobacterium paraintracellulare]|nr:hypothetical protein MINTM019_20620 [Mycobacterium paraintracellulare]
MLRVNRRPRHVIARARTKLTAAPEPVAESVAEPVTDTETAPEPPRREHLFGSQYVVRQSMEETLRQRGFTGQSALYRRQIAARGDFERARDAAAHRAGYRPGEVLWPSG